MAKFSFKEVLSGDILTKSWLQRQYKVILLISVLIFMYIYSGLRCQQQQQTLSYLQKELNDAKLVQLSLKAELMDKTRQSSITKMLSEQQSEVKPSKTPPIRVQ
jgi:Na+-transporting NADH:ubiquinone oxidoreductase subunit NqrC